MNLPRAWLFIIIVFIISSIQLNLISGESQNLEIILQEDLEDNDGGFSHEGFLDEWQWGEPGAGPGDNPGPGVAGEGNRCFGIPLNSTYGEGAYSYLLIPEQGIGSYRNILLDYLIWFDLDLLSDEANETGEGNQSDHLLVQVETEEGPWITVMNHSGSSSGEWIDVNIDLSMVDSEVLNIRFLLVDVPDGRTDNGVFIDLVRISGELRPQVDIRFRNPPTLFTISPAGESVIIHFTVLNGGRTIPPGTYVEITVNGPEGWGPVTDIIDIDSERIQHSEYAFQPWDQGLYDSYINLSVDGEILETYKVSTEAVEPIFFDDFSRQLENWNPFTDTGDSEWSIMDTQAPSFSSGSVVYFGRLDEEERPIGFEGSVFSGLTSSPVDLVNINEAHLYMITSYGFLGEQGSCGGIVQGKDSGGNWLTLEPDLPHYRPLKEDISGPLAGRNALQGDRDWYQLSFDLGEIIGSITTIRIAVSSGMEGEGRGWFIDDVIIAGEGFDPYDTEPPEPLMGVEVEIMDDGWVEVEWTPSFASDLHHYNIYLGEGSPSGVGVENLIAVIDGENETVAAFRDLDSKKSYWIAITAVDRNGNELKNPDQVTFIPRSGGGNQPPVAKGRVLGTSVVRIGEEFRFNASASFDPDGDPITYGWTFPDGTGSTGIETDWESSISGNDLIVELVVKDPYGASSTYNLTVSVKEGDTGDVEGEDIVNFLLCMIPVTVVVIMVVIVVVSIRRSRERRLKRRLMGLEITNETRADVGVGERLSRVPGKISELVPVHTTRSRKKKEEEQPSSEKAPRKHDSDQMSQPHDPAQGGRGRSASGKENGVVTAVIECPYCSKVFRKKVQKQRLVAGGSIGITCPHCGKSGET
jgi:hypothetical protein